MKLPKHPTNQTHFCGFMEYVGQPERVPNTRPQA